MSGVDLHSPAQPRFEGFHEGERGVQDRAGLGAEAARLEGMLEPHALSPGASAFLSAQTFAVLASRDAMSRLWSSPLSGPAGFLRGDVDTVQVLQVPAPGDPLHQVRVGAHAALLAFDPSRRRRLRVNGSVVAAAAGAFAVRVVETFGNCPAYIERRVLAPAVAASATTESALTADGFLTSTASGIVQAADTFFLGSEHPIRGADASHKGGPAGFVRVEGHDVLWPDFAGNNMFNSLGNISVDSSAAVLFIDFERGVQVQLSGTAVLEWTSRPTHPTDFVTGRQVRFTPSAGFLTASPLREANA